MGRDTLLLGMERALSLQGTLEGEGGFRAGRVEWGGGKNTPLNFLFWVMTLGGDSKTCGYFS